MSAEYPFALRLPVFGAIILVILLLISIYFGYNANSFSSNEATFWSSILGVSGTVMLGAVAIFQSNKYEKLNENHISQQRKLLNKQNELVNRDSRQKVTIFKIEQIILLKNRLRDINPYQINTLINKKMISGAYEDLINTSINEVSLINNEIVSIMGETYKLEYKESLIEFKNKFPKVEDSTKATTSDYDPLYNAYQNDMNGLLCVVFERISELSKEVCQ